MKKTLKMIDKTLHIKLKIDQKEPMKNTFTIRNWKSNVFGCKVLLWTRNHCRFLNVGTKNRVKIYTTKHLFSISFVHCIVGFIPSHLTIPLSVLFLLICPLHCRFYSFLFDHSIVGFIPSYLTIPLSVLFLLIWLLHCRFYSFSFDHCIVGSILSHLTIALSILFLLIWPLHCRFLSFSFDHCIVGFIPSHLTIPL
jgi:hypothetical protein